MIDRTLDDGRIVVGGDADEMAVVAEARGEGGGEGDEADLGVGGVSVLRGLRDVFGDDEFWAESFVEVEMLQSGLRGSSVGGVLRIGDGDGFDSGCGEDVEGKGGEAGVVAGPENEGSAGVGDGLGLFGAACIDDALGEGSVGGEEEIEGCSVDDFGGEGGGGLVGGFGVDAGLLLEGGEEGREEGFEVGGGGDAEGFCLGVSEGCEEEQEEKRGMFCPLKPTAGLNGAPGYYFLRVRHGGP